MAYLVWGINRFRGVKNIRRRRILYLSVVLSAVKIMSDGYYNSKKTDDICDDVCGQVCFISILFKIFEITFLFEKKFVFLKSSRFRQIRRARHHCSGFVILSERNNLIAREPFYSADQNSQF